MEHPVTESGAGQPFEGRQILLAPAGESSGTGADEASSAADPSPARPNPAVLPAVHSTALTGPRFAWIIAWRGAGILILLASLGILAISQVILNVGRWLNWDMQFLAPLYPLACAWPGFCQMRYPAYTFLGFVAVLLASLLFGWWVWRLTWPKVEYSRQGSPLSWVVAEFSADPVSLQGLRRLVSLQGAVVLLIFLACEGYVVYQAIMDRPVMPLIWLGGLVFLLLLALVVDRAGGVSQVLPARRDIGYLAGIVAMLVAVAAFFSDHYGLAGASILATLILLFGYLEQGWRDWNWPQRLERLAIPIISLGSFMLMTYGLRAWNWSIIGDEYAFYNLGRQFALGQAHLPLLSGAGVDGFHPVLSSAFQGASMWLFGSDSYGWRVSNSFLLVLAIPPFYYFSRHLIGRVGGLMMVSLYGCAHVLLSFGKIGYNNTQVVIIMALALAAFSWAAARRSLAGFVLTGIFLGLGFYTFGVGRLYGLAIAVWLLIYYFPRYRTTLIQNLAVWTAVVGAGALTIIPVVSTRSAWQGQLRHTFLSSEVTHSPVGILFQLWDNTLYGFTSFLTNDGHSHFVFGPHADPLTGSLMVLGLAGLIFSWRLGWRVRAALLGMWVVLVVLIAGIQQYGYPSNTRTFALVPLYALFAAIGFSYLWQALAVTLGAVMARDAEQRPAPVLALPLAVLALVAIVPLNVWLSVDLSQQKLEVPPQAFMLQTAQLTGDISGSGPRIYLVVRPDYNMDLIRMMFQAYDIPLERLVRLLPQAALLGDTPGTATTNPQAAVPAFCQAASEPAVFIVARDVPEVDPIRARVESCWPGTEERLVKDATGRPHLYRFITQAGLSYFRDIAGEWQEETPAKAAAGFLNLPPVVITDKGIWGVAQPRDVAAGGPAQTPVAAIEIGTKFVAVFDGNGRRQKVMGGDLVDPAAVAFTPAGDLVVLDAGAPDVLVWFDQNGRIQRRLGSGMGFYSPRGLYVAADGTIYVADTGSSRVVHLSENGQILGRYNGGGKFPQPTSVAVEPGKEGNGRLAVADPTTGFIYILDAQDRLLGQIPFSKGNTVDKPGMVWMADGTLIVADTEKGRVVRLDPAQPEAAPIKEWTNLARPTGLSLGKDNRLYVTETAADRVTILSIP
ncbi:MAG: hypothetical protein EXR62_01270 [Chloroflexi bacterium]|nr:hypothetical protein [Chloroflexota bacterium]